MGTKLPKLAFLLILVSFTSFALAQGNNGVNLFDMVYSDTDATDGDVYWGISGPFDLDSDGYEELIGYTDDGGITMHLYENDGDDAYVQKWSHNISDVIYSYEMADQEMDMDRDGLPEIVVGGKAGLSGDYDGVFIFELDTTAEDVALTRVASFQPHVVAGTGAGGSVITLWGGDLDGDTVEEILLSETEADYVMVISLDTTSTFDFPQWNAEFVDSTFDYSAWSTVVGDFDGDGTTNFAFQEWDYNAIAFYDVLGPDDYENIYWSDDITEEDGGSLRSLDAADLNGDGYTEVVLPSNNGNVYVYTNDGDLSSFDPLEHFAMIFESGYNGYGGHIRDVDSWRGGDGLDIIFCSDSILFDVEWVGEDGDVLDPLNYDVFEIAHSPAIPDLEMQDLALGDFDNDGLDDIAVVDVENPQIIIYEHDGFFWADAELVYSAMATEAGQEPGYQTRGISAGSDLDNDGLKEVIVTDYQVHGVHIFEGTADNTLEWVATLADDSTTYWATPRSVITGDLDGNGRGEVIWMGMRAAEEPYNGIQVWEWDGVDGSDVYERYVLNIEIDGVEVDRYYGEYPVNVGDVDQDGVTELLIANNGSDHAYDVFMIASVDGTFESGFFSLVTEYVVDQNAGIFGGSPWGCPNMGDLDGDGDLEALFLAWDHLTLLVVEATGEDSYELQTAVMIDSAFTDKANYGQTFVADVDGNGHDEIYGGAYSAGWLWSVTAGDDASDISFENGDITIISDFGATWDITGGDIDADGVPELYTVDYSHARIYGYTYDAGVWEQEVVQNWSGTMGGFALDFGEDIDGDNHAEIIQGFLEVPGTTGNPEGYVFAVTEFAADYTVGVAEWNVITPADYKLAQNYPNPFNPNTTIEFSLPLAKDISLTVYDMLGREVVRLADNYYQKGDHSVVWNGKYADGRLAPAGLYLYELRAGNVVKTAKMTLLK